MTASRDQLLVVIATVEAALDTEREARQRAERELATHRAITEHATRHIDEGTREIVRLRAQRDETAAGLVALSEAAERAWAAMRGGACEPGCTPFSSRTDDHVGKCHEEIVSLTTLRMALDATPAKLADEVRARILRDTANRIDVLPKDPPPPGTVAQEWASWLRKLADETGAEATIDWKAILDAERDARAEAEYHADEAVRNHGAMIDEYMAALTRADNAEAAIVALQEAAAKTLAAWPSKAVMERSALDGLMALVAGLPLCDAIAATPVALAGQVRARVLREAADAVERYGAQSFEPTCSEQDVCTGIARRLSALADEAKKA
jgi:hypothetical protein